MIKHVLNGFAVVGLTLTLAIPYAFGVALGASFLAFRTGFVLGFHRLGDALAGTPQRVKR